MPEASKPQAITEEEVKNLFQLWNSALATEDPDAVAKRYSKQPVLLPTVSDIPRTDYALIKDYFVGFLKKKPQGEILESYVTIGNSKSMMFRLPPLWSGPLLTLAIPLICLKTGAKIMESMSSQWEPLETRSKADTHSFTSGKMANGRSATTTPVLCLKHFWDLLPSLQLRRKKLNLRKRSPHFSELRIGCNSVCHCFAGISFNSGSGCIIQKNNNKKI